MRATDVHMDANGLARNGREANVPKITRRGKMVLFSLAHGVAAARLLKVPGTWTQTVAGITCRAGSLHRVGCWHQRQSGVGCPYALTRLVATHRYPHCSVYYLYHLVRRTRLILALILLQAFNHLVLTGYYSAAIPTSLSSGSCSLAAASSRCSSEKRSGPQYT
jgi:hypothetical protein